MRTVHAVVAVLVILPWPTQAADQIPTCRFDDSRRTIVSETLNRAIAVYRDLGKPLSIERVEVNPGKSSDDASTLKIVIARDAAAGKVSADGCATAAIGQGDALDALSVRGGCLVVAVGRMEMRCSSGALEIFSRMGAGTNRANPTLLYVLSHELAHLHQRHIGAYAGGVERVELKLDREAKLSSLREACDPVSTSREEEADAIALQVLIRLLAQPPYRETILSERGSLYWNIDLLALGSDAWRKHVIEREAISQPTMHASFNPSQFPTPPKVVEANAKRFVCDVLTKRAGTIAFPGKSATHPPLEQRLRRIAEALRPVADRLPATGSHADFKPVARLQQDVSPILTKIYQETGVYLESVQSKICSIVNGPRPDRACR